MTSLEFSSRLRDRASSAAVVVSDAQVSALEAYFHLLGRWNSKINLTALPLSKPTDATFDRLLIEPLAAAQFVEDVELTWIDLGSGGGSPALPMKIARPGLRLTMVESKSRKAAFLREAARCLELSNIEIANLRFEGLPANQMADLVTARAVRTDSALFEVAAGLLKPASGRLLIFCSRPQELEHSRFVPMPGSPSFALFHVKQCD
jgi:16S rRNA (guanine527-N7)-methyltransferase